MDVHLDVYIIFIEDIWSLETQPLFITNAT